MMIAHEKTRALVARVAGTETEGERKRGEPLPGLLDIELHVHVTHLVAFPGLDAGTRNFDHLTHFLFRSPGDEFKIQRRARIGAGRGTALRLALSKRRAAPSATQAGSPVSPLKSQ